MSSRSNEKLNTENAAQRADGEMSLAVELTVESIVEAALCWRHADGGQTPAVAVGDRFATSSGKRSQPGRRRVGHAPGLAQPWH
jgi:hypothetical protein